MSQLGELKTLGICFLTLLLAASPRSMSLDQNESVHRSVLALEALGENLFLPLLDAGGILMVSSGIPWLGATSLSSQSLSSHHLS